MGKDQAGSKHNSRLLEWGDFFTQSQAFHGSSHEEDVDEEEKRIHTGSRSSRSYNSSPSRVYKCTPTATS